MNPSISHCPECGYCLTGLPARHRCPECGFEYDEFTRVWKPSNPRSVYVSLMAVFGVGWANSFRLASNFMLDGRRGWRGWMDFFGFLIWCALSFFIVWASVRAYSANRRGRFVAIGPRGLSIRTTGDTQTVPWESIRDFKCDPRAKPWLTLVLADETLQSRINVLFSNQRDSASVHWVITESDREAFATAANEAIRRYREGADAARRAG